MVPTVYPENTLILVRTIYIIEWWIIHEFVVLTFCVQTSRDGKITKPGVTESVSLMGENVVTSQYLLGGCYRLLVPPEN